MTGSNEAKSNFYEDLHNLLENISMIVLVDFSVHAGTGRASWERVLGVSAVVLIRVPSREPAQHTVSSLPTLSSALRRRKTDHHLVISEIRLRLQSRERPEDKRPPGRLNTVLFNVSAYRLDFNNQLAQRLKKLHALDDSTAVETQLRQLRSAIHFTVLDIHGVPCRRYQDWFDSKEEARNLLVEKNRLRNAYASGLTEAGEIAFFRGLHLVQQQLREMQYTWAPLKIISESERVSYMLEIEECQIPNETHPGRVFVIRDRYRKENRAFIPLGLCNQLCQQLLSCAESRLTDNTSPKTDAADGGKTMNSSTLHDSDPKVFDLSKLNPVEIKNEQLNFQLKIESVPPGTADENGSEKSRRWLSTSPLQKTDTHTQEGDLSKCGSSQQWVPWNNGGTVEIYEPLIPDLIGFLMDASIRYRTIDTPPMVNALYSMSGDRRFYFDLRNTRWGHRLFLSQVTDFHRNVIAIPVETLTDFRDRINTFIEKLHLEDDKNLRDALQEHSAPQRYWKRYPKMRPNFANGTYPPPRAQQLFVDGHPIVTETAVGVPVDAHMEANVKRIRQASGSKGSTKSRNRTSSRTSAAVASATDSVPHRSRQISTSSKGASKSAKQVNGQTDSTQPRDVTHQKQTPIKQQQQQQQQQAPKDQATHANNTTHQAGDAPNASGNKGSTDQPDEVQPKPPQSSSRSQQQQQHRHWPQASRPKKSGANRTTQQSGEVSGPSRDKPRNSLSEAHDTQSQTPQVPTKQQNYRKQAPGAWNRSTQRAAHEIDEVSTCAENALNGEHSEQTKPQHLLPEQKVQQYQNHQHLIQNAGSSRPAEQRPAPTPAASADSPKVEQPHASMHGQQQHAPKPMPNQPQIRQGSPQKTQTQASPQQKRGQWQTSPRQDAEEKNVPSGEKLEKESAVVTSEEKAASAPASGQAPMEVNTETEKKERKKSRPKKRRGTGVMGVSDSGQEESEQGKKESGNVEDNSQESMKA
nr:unnamed protein product [Spirometra erinaceieuropaei]